MSSDNSNQLQKFNQPTEHVVHVQNNKKMSVEIPFHNIPELEHYKGVTEKGLEMIAKSKSANTRRTYFYAYKNWFAYCRKHELFHFPVAPQTLVNYITELAEKKVSLNTINTYLRAISMFHKFHNVEDRFNPALNNMVNEAFKGIRNDYSERSKDEDLMPKKAPKLPTNHLFEAVRELRDDNIHDLRDKALVLWHYFGGFRRAELLSLLDRNIVWDEELEAYEVKIVNSKTDKKKEGRYVKIPMVKGDPTICPVVAYRNYRNHTSKNGFAFRRIGRKVTNGKRQFEDKPLSFTGYNYVIDRLFGNLGVSTHSFRSAFITDAIKINSPIDEIQKQVGHKRVDQTLSYNQSKTMKKNAVDRLARRAGGDEEE